MGNSNSSVKGENKPKITVNSESTPLIRPTSLTELPRRISQPGVSSKCPSSPCPASSSSSSSGLTKTSSISSRISRRNSPHPVSPQSREIIQFCFDNPHGEIGNRICCRILDKRIDFQQFVESLGKDKWLWLTNMLREYLEEVVRNVENTEKIEELSRHYGEEHVALRKYGFKPDMWVSLADAIIMECIILDMANHQPADTVAAWSQLVSTMFTSVRDGYYATLRHQRRASRKSVSTQNTVYSTVVEAGKEKIIPKEEIFSQS